MKYRDLRLHPPRFPRPRRASRRGAILIYTVVSLVALVGLCSLAVDLGHVQLTKTELQRAADATARGYMEYYILYGKTYANSNGPQLYTTANNPVDGNSGVAPTVSVTWGYWTSGTHTFTAGAGTPVAVKVTVSRTATNSNGVPLTWGQAIGRPTCDVTVSAIAVMVGTSQSVAVNVPATSDPYLAGMAGGSTASVDDTTSNAAAYQVPSITVTPGSYLTFTSLTGTTNQGPGWAYNSPGGWSGVTTNHTPGGGENGIGDATMNLDSFVGLFLGSGAPSSTAAPASVDWTNPSNLNKTSYDNLALKQPFYIGTGATTGGVTQQFLVPAGATRLFLASWDGYEWNNNNGSFSGTVTVKPTVQLVQ